MDFLKDFDDFDVYDDDEMPLCTWVKQRPEDWEKIFKRLEIEMVMRIYGFTKQKAEALIAKRLAERENNNE